MTSYFSRFVALAAFAVCLASRLSVAIGQTEDPAGFTVQPSTSSVVARVYKGTVDCERCHSSPQESDRRAGVTQRVALTEFATWRDRDWHAQAHLALRGPRAKQMARRLAKLRKSGEQPVDLYDVKTGCVQCHTLHDPGGTYRPDSSAVREFDRGISCEVCHGPSSQWNLPHNDPQWRAKTQRERETTNWVELRDPQVRAEMCHACHVGSPKDGKNITHDMYVAGHPALPSLEIETASDRMPLHWRYGYDKPSGDNIPFVRTRNLLVANIVALRMTMEALRADAEKAQPNYAADLARFDCYACHHDLARPSWRQRRSNGTRPGRPQIPRWTVPLATVTAKQWSPPGTPALDEQMRRLQRAFEKRVFGDAAKIEVESKGVADWCNVLLAALAAHERITAPEARGLLRNLCREGAETPVDFETARQLAGAATIVYAELRRANAVPVGPELTAVFQRWQAVFRLGRDYDALPKFPADPNAPEYALQLGKLSAQANMDYRMLLQQRASYSAEQFRGDLRALRRALD